ncbi:MAG: ion transporter [Pseudomonadales bacterium RIFCSPLOWO2_02_FULL_63_210]|nr:MAG: ion transporter [Pseudomonadales bacterium RIFCSPLOWO2_02_FULL_63_210]
MRGFCARVVSAGWFEPFMIGCIIANGIIIGLETSKDIDEAYGQLLHLGNDIFLVIFIIEAALKITAVAPRLRLYFGNGWNLFDFTVVVLSLVPSTGEFALVARLIRVLRVLRLVSAVPQLRLIVATLVRSIPSMGHVILLMGVIFYIYGVTGYHLFHAHDADNWGTLGAALLTLFQIVTLEGWVDVMETAMEALPWAWVYFVTFVLIGTFVMLNLFIAVVINNLEASKVEELNALSAPPTHDELVRELERTRAALDALQRRLAAAGGASLAIERRPA